MTDKLVQRLRAQNETRDENETELQTKAADALESQAANILSLENVNDALQIEIEHLWRLMRKQEPPTTSDIERMAKAGYDQVIIDVAEKKPVGKNAWGNQDEELKKSWTNIVNAIIDAMENTNAKTN
jgi:hypothetical protein